MVRGKVELKRIENVASRQVTFTKRRNGLLKKAYELSVLCDAEVAVIIFSQKGKLYQFCNNDIEKTIHRYRKYVKEVRSQLDRKIHTQEYLQHLKHETSRLTKEIEVLQSSKRRLLGQDIKSCSQEELQDIDKQQQKALISIKTRKAQLFMKQIEQLETKERILSEENARLCKQYDEYKELKSNLNKKIKEVSQSSTVEIKLFIGLPQTSFQ